MMNTGTIVCGLSLLIGGFVWMGRGGRRNPTYSRHELTVRIPRLRRMGRR
jgi:hypothetical protein